MALWAAVLVLSAVHCTQPADTAVESADRMLREGKETYRLQGAKRALPKFQEALRIYRQAGGREGEAEALRYQGNCRLQSAEYDLAAEDFQQSLALHRQLGDLEGAAKSLNNLGLAYWNVADYPKALQVLDRGLAIAEELDDPRIRGAALSNLGLVYDELGRHSESLEHYQAALDDFRSSGFSRGIADALANLGGRALLLGDYRQAVQHLRGSLQVSLQGGLQHQSSLALGNMGLAQLGLGGSDRALTLLSEALEAARRSGARKQEADWMRARGKVLLWTAHYEEAWDDLHGAAEFYANAGMKVQESAAWREIGAASVLLGDLAAAEDALRRSLQAADSLAWPAGGAAARIALGDLQWHRREPAQALTWYRAACRSIEDGQDESLRTACLMRAALALSRLLHRQEARATAILALEAAERLKGEPLLAQAQTVRGHVEQSGGDPSAALPFYRSALESSLQGGFPEAAWRIAYYLGTCLRQLGAKEEAARAFEQSIDLLESVRQGLERDRFHAGYIDSRDQPYKALVPLLLELGQDAQALLVAERLRNRPFPGAHASPALTSLALQQAPESQSRLPDGTLDSVFGRLEEQGWPSRRTDMPDPTAADPAERLARFRQRLRPGTAVIEYLQTAEGLAAFVLTRDRFHSLLTPVRSESLTTRVSLLRERMAKTGRQDYRAPARGLYRLLIAPLQARGWLEGITRLSIVPHGVLHYLPFSALLSEGGSAVESMAVERRESRSGKPGGLRGPASEGIRFLVQDFTVSYLAGLQSASSGDPLAAVNGNQGVGGGGHGKTGGGGGSLASPPAGKDILALVPQAARLANASQEVRRIEEVFQSEVCILMGTEATEPFFKKLAPDYRFLHLATHGAFDRRNPLGSALVLESGPGGDGLLEAREIMELRLNADLVFLSACETALGAGYYSDIPPGDDFRGLTQAFLDAGSRAVLASLWKVDDLATAHFAGRFYAERASGDAEAIAAVQREMLRNDRFAHPFFWAPFVLVEK
ncbi:MAG TPA: CHAT domain-containing protein [Acidobacteriota bacterium]|nr:CHAT domain-containing protein [Acidobacteriota bacterium]